MVIDSFQTCVYCASSIISTTSKGVQQEFGVAAEAATVGVTVFMFGLAFGPLLMSPMSEFLGEIHDNPFFISFSPYIFREKSDI